jgi:hypothetical protein
MMRGNDFARARGAHQLGRRVPNKSHPFADGQSCPWRRGDSAASDHLDYPIYWVFESDICFEEILVRWALRCCSLKRFVG